MLKNPLQVTCEYLWSAKDRHSWCDLYVLVLLEKALQKLFPTRKTKKQGHIVVYEVLISNLWLWKINFQFFNFSYNTKTRLFVHFSFSNKGPFVNCVLNLIFVCAQKKYFSTASKTQIAYFIIQKCFENFKFWKKRKNEQKP